MSIPFAIDFIFHEIANVMTTSTTARISIAMIIAITHKGKLALSVTVVIISAARRYYKYIIIIL